MGKPQEYVLTPKTETVRVMEEIQELRVVAATLKKGLNDALSKYHGVFAIMISFLLQNGREMRLNKANVVPLDVREYMIDTEDAPESNEIIYRLKHFTDA